MFKKLKRNTIGRVQDFTITKLESPRRRFKISLNGFPPEYPKRYISLDLYYICIALIYYKAERRTEKCSTVRRAIRSFLNTIKR